MTNNLLHRVNEYGEGKIDGFTKTYSCKKLVYYEYFQHVYNAIEREKEIKKWRREKKHNLIKALNPLKRSI